jgi:hypothetical protein
MNKRLVSQLDYYLGSGQEARSNAFNKIPRSHECLDNPAMERWVLTGAGIQGSRLGKPR